MYTVHGARWAETNDMLVGHSCDPGICPIARWLNIEMSSHIVSQSPQWVQAHNRRHMPTSLSQARTPTTPLSAP